MARVIVRQHPGGASLGLAPSLPPRRVILAQLHATHQGLATAAVASPRTTLVSVHTLTDVSGPSVHSSDLTVLDVPHTGRKSESSVDTSTMTAGGASSSSGYCVGCLNSHGSTEDSLSTVRSETASSAGPFSSDHTGSEAADGERSDGRNEAAVEQAPYVPTWRREVERGVQMCWDMCSDCGYCKRFGESLFTGEVGSRSDHPCGHYEIKRPLIAQEGVSLISKNVGVMFQPGTVVEILQTRVEADKGVIRGRIESPFAGWITIVSHKGDRLAVPLDTTVLIDSSLGWISASLAFTTTGQWVLGEYGNDGSVRWQMFSVEAAGRSMLASFSITTSRVLFRPDGVPIGFFSADGVGCAVILEAYRNNLITPDRAVVEKAVRNGDAPFVPPDRHPLNQWFMKRVMQAVFTRSTVGYFGTFPLRNQSLCYFDVAHSPGVRGHVALSIDDAPCRFDRANSRVKEVRELLAEYHARATFMVVGKWVDGHEEDMVELLKDGHEFGNHAMLDRRYDMESHEDFVQAVDDCNGQIYRLQKAAGVPESVRWFRCPHGKFTQRMHDGISSRKLVNVMCDTYASCPIVQDGEFIGQFLARYVMHGGIIVIHMPELGVREWCFDGLRHLLEGLRRRELRAVTVSELDALSRIHLEPSKEATSFHQASGFSESGQRVPTRTR